MLDDVEDLNLFVESVGRAWIVDYVPGVPEPLQALSPSDAGLNLAPDQSPLGALRFTLAPYFGYVSYSFGVPVPAQVGESTLTAPGDITSFTHLRFLAQSASNLSNRRFMVILETYPDPGGDQEFPKLYWNFDVPLGNSFQKVSLNLREPDLVLHSRGVPVEELLAQTRYLAFYFYAESTNPMSRLVVWLDDMELIYDESVPTPTVTPTPTPTPDPGPAEGAGWMLY